MYSVQQIATIHNSFKDKFGLPRQSGLLQDEVSTIIFDEKYRDDNSLRGLDGYSHIWLLWIFSQVKNEKDFSPTVRPPRLDGNTRMGVFATRSPYHPNKIGMSCVKIKEIRKTREWGTVIDVYGADLMDSTPIIDIKPYLSISDRIDDAICGFSELTSGPGVEVEFDNSIQVHEEVKCKITDILSQDPRPAYRKDSDRVFGLKYGNFEVKFTGNEHKIKVISVEEI